MQYKLLFARIISLFSLGGIVPMNIQGGLVSVMLNRALGWVVRLDHSKLIYSAERCGTGLKIRRGYP